MASVRRHLRIDVPASRAWTVIRDAGAVADWFPSIAESRLEGDVRVCTLSRGGSVREQVITVDDDLRRFQYRIVEGMPVSGHLATIDVLELEPRACLVVYGTDLEPAGAAPALGRAIEAGLDGLRRHLNGDPAAA